MPRLLTRLGAVLTVSLGLLLGSGMVAGAHVTVHSGEAVQGTTAELAFRVPTESDTASTVKLAVAFPADTPVASVSVLPRPGWTYQVTRTTLPNPVPAGHGELVSEVVGQIEWSAAGPDVAVKPGEYQVFTVIAGPLPTTDRIVFKVVQTYSDGQVSRWIDEPVAAGAPEPEHPAPVLALAASAGAAHSGHGTPAAGSAASTGGGTPSAAWWILAAVTLIAVLAALWAVLIAIRAARRRGGDVATA